MSAVGILINDDRDLLFTRRTPLQSERGAGYRLKRDR